MLKRVTIVGLFILLGNWLPAEATSFICWDGSMTTDGEYCEPEPRLHKFDLKGMSTGGAIVTVSQHDGQIFDLEITEFGEMGKTEFLFSSARTIAIVILTKYNRPFYHNEFDSALSDYDVTHLLRKKSDNGKQEFYDEQGRISERMTCIVDKINSHITKHKNQVPDLNVVCK